MISEIRSLLNQYNDWLRDNTTLREVSEDWIEITSPYLDRHNDLIQVYVSRRNGDFILSDDGYTINDLRLSGCDPTTPKRQALLQITLNGFGVQQEYDALTIKATAQNFPLKKHNLLQAMLAVNDLFYLAEPQVSSLFFEDVESWLSRERVRFIPRVKFTGKSGYDHFFDFAIPKSNGTPERIVNAINNPIKSMAIRAAFSWVDTKESRPQNSMMFALLNDNITSPSNDVIEALRSYEITPVLWSRRGEAQEVLAS